MLNDRARMLRQNATETEQRMWHYLRDRQLGGFKFNRQFVIKPYIVDFICRERMLIIEIDGSQHNEQIEYDKERTLFLEGQGYKILRFWNNEVLVNYEAVLTSILFALEELPLTRPFGAPSPASGRGKL